MDLALSENEERLRQEARLFVRQEAPKDVLLALEETETGYTPELWDKMIKTGWPGAIIPAPYGGVGGPLTSAAVLFEELGRGPLPGPYFSSCILGSLILLQAGSEEQKRGLLPGIAKGKQALCLALAEAEYGWTPESVQMTARSRQGAFVLNGVKLFVHDAQAATHIICVARSGQSGTPTEGITLFLVDRSSPGVSVRHLSGFLGWCYEVEFNSVRVPASAVLGEVGGGWQPLQEAIEKAIPVLSAYQVGGCQAVFEMSVAHSQSRVQFGQPIGRFQRIQDHIVDIVNNLDAARWTTYEALWKLDTGRPATESVHLAKAVSSQAYVQACTSAHHVHGGIGYSRGFGLTLHTRMSRSLYHQLGDPHHHRRCLAHLLGF